MITLKAQVSLKGVPAGERGSVLLEAIWALLLILISVGFNLEVIRGAQYQVLFHHWAFLYVRFRALGASETVSKREVLKIASASLEEGELRRIHRVMTFESWQSSRGKIFGRLIYRYPGLLGMLNRYERFQLTKVCRF